MITIVKLTVNAGGMFAGKTTELLRQGERHVRAGHAVFYVKPAVDKRYATDKIVTHSGISVEAISIPEGEHVLDLLPVVKYDETLVVLFDEVQFFDSKLLLAIGHLLRTGAIVYCSGLDMDFNGAGFEITKELMACADVVNKMHAVCDTCGVDAVMSAKRITDTSTTERIDVGAGDKYVPLCRCCYTNQRQGGLC